MAIPVNTVLILGAGSSRHAGYPLGVDLLNQICDRLQHQQVHAEISARYSKDALEEFRVRLSRSNYRSIDTFLEQNQDCSELGKLLIADRLKDCEDVNALFPPQSPDWYSLLFDAMRSDDPVTFCTSPLTIISFNYDRSLEAYLYESMLAHYHGKLTRNAAFGIIKTLHIVHPHGVLGEYPEVSYQKSFDGVKLADIARNIKIIHEFRDSASGFVNSEFEHANIFLRAAKRIIFLGFGFHDDNIRRFQFFEPAAVADKQIFATAMFGGQRQFESLQARLDRYGITPSLRRGDCQWLLSEVVSLDQA